jgi:hypothetical protein
MLFEQDFVERPLNTRGRDLVVGALHGQLDRLRRLLDWVEFDMGLGKRNLRSLGSQNASG